MKLLAIALDLLLSFGQHLFLVVGNEFADLINYRLMNFLVYFQFSILSSASRVAAYNAFVISTSCPSVYGLIISRA